MKTESLNAEYMGDKVNVIHVTRNLLYALVTTDKLLKSGIFSVNVRDLLNVKKKDLEKLSKKKGAL